MPDERKRKTPPEWEPSGGHSSDDVYQAYEVVARDAAAKGKSMTFVPFGCKGPPHTTSSGGLGKGQGKAAGQAGHTSQNSSTDLHCDDCDDGDVVEVKGKSKDNTVKGTGTTKSQGVGPTKGSGKTKGEQPAKGIGKTKDEQPPKGYGKTKDGEVGPMKGNGKTKDVAQPGNGKGKTKDEQPAKGTGKTKDGEVGPTKGSGKTKDVAQPGKGNGKTKEGRAMERPRMRNLRKALERPKMEKLDLRKEVERQRM